MNYKKQATDFKRKHNVTKVTSSNLCTALNEQGYTVIEFNGIVDNDDVAALRDTLGVGQYMTQSRCFTYRDDKRRLVFIHEDFTEEERQITLAHEEGHIWNDHLIQAGILGNDVIQEYQANEFAHFLLKDKTGKQKWRRIVTILVIFMLLIGTGIGIYIRNQHDKAVYTEDLYRTETGK